MKHYILFLKFLGIYSAATLSETKLYDVSAVTTTPFQFMMSVQLQTLMLMHVFQHFYRNSKGNNFYDPCLLS